jgi:hypothetical protein
MEDGEILFIEAMPAQLLVVATESNGSNTSLISFWKSNSSISMSYFLFVALLISKTLPQPK